MKKFAKAVRGFAIILALLFTVSGVLTANASEEQETTIKINTLQEIQAATQVYESADETAASLGTLEAGTPVIVMEEPQGEWCKVKYQEMEGYVPLASLTGYGDGAAIEKEFNKEQDNTRRAIDELEVEKQQKKQMIIWGCIIGALVIAIFAVGIVSAIRKNKREKAQRPIYKG